MKIDQIEIFSGKPDFEYKAIRRLEVKCEASNALMPAPTVDEANGRLRALAAKVGANAIVEVDYNSGVSFTSWKRLKATGLAVKKVSDEVVCPFCAETVKRAAIKCRYCGSKLPNASLVETTSSTLVPPTVPPQSVAFEEPLRDNNNPALIIGLVIVAFVILGALLSAAG